MPKPWELDWNAGAPAPDLMPLPIVPFFGRQRPPMLGDGGAAIDAAGAPAAGPYGMVAADPSMLLAGGFAPLLTGDPSLMQAATQASLSIPDSSGTPSAPSSQPVIANTFAPATPMPASVANPAPQESQLTPAASPSIPDPMSGTAGRGWQSFLQPAGLGSWGAMGSQVPTPPDTQPDAISLPLRLAALQMPAAEGGPAALSPGMRTGRAQPPANGRAGVGPPSAPIRQPLPAASANGRNGTPPPQQPVAELYGPHGAVNRDVLGDRIERVGERSRQWQVSPRGAMGVMQLTLDTARETARHLGVALDENRLRTDEAYNRALGRGRVNHLLDRYHGDPVLATAAYNAGTGSVHRWIGQFGDPSQGEISDAEFARRIPYRETRAYIQRVVYGQMPAQPQHHRHHHR